MPQVVQEKNGGNNNKSFLALTGDSGRESKSLRSSSSLKADFIEAGEGHVLEGGEISTEKVVVLQGGAGEKPGVRREAAGQPSWGVALFLGRIFLQPHFLQPGWKIVSSPYASRCHVPHWEVQCFGTAEKSSSMQRPSHDPIPRRSHVLLTDSWKVSHVSGERVQR